MFFAIVASLLLAVSDFKISFGQPIKPIFLLMFFSGVDLCADLRLLKRGGKTLLLFLLVLFPYWWPWQVFSSPDSVRNSYGLPWISQRSNG